MDGVKIKCWRSIGHGSQTLQEGLTNSCNCVFMELALRLGVDKFYEYMQKFGLGEKTGIGLSGEASGILMDKGLVKTVDLARMGFGHAVAVTPIQLLNSVCAILNDGNLLVPTVVKNITDCYGNTLLQTTQTTKRKVVSSETSRKICQMLSLATNKTGPYTFLEGYDVGGKTGTAQKYDQTGHIAQENIFQVSSARFLLPTQIIWLWLWWMSQVQGRITEALLLLHMVKKFFQDCLTI